MSGFKVRPVPPRYCWPNAVPLTWSAVLDRRFTGQVDKVLAVFPNEHDAETYAAALNAGTIHPTPIKVSA